jgi:hypothetical protein
MAGHPADANHTSDEQQDRNQEYEAAGEHGCGDYAGRPFHSCTDPDNEPSRRLVAMRPKQWAKNAFVLVGTLFGHRWAGADLLDAGLAFVAFCLASSAVYLYNDWIDRAADRRHPVKRSRAIAAGRLGGRQVALLALLLAAGAYALAAVRRPDGVPGVGLSGAECRVLAVARTGDRRRLCHAGNPVAAVRRDGRAGIPPSHWLLCGFALTLLLALGKRRANSSRQASLLGNTRSVLGTTRCRCWTRCWALRDAHAGAYGYTID